LTHWFWRLIYEVTPLPALLLGVVALGVLVLGFWYVRLRPWRRQALFFLLLLLLGPGLVVNVLLKDTIGKPRPREIIEFGGQYRHSQFWEPGTTGGNSSFPSGHASIAFAAMGPWFFLRQRRKQMAVAFLVSGIGWGAVVGAARILQGGHFFSDVVWAGGLVYLVGWLLALCFSFDRSPAVAKMV
jgi:membrane-associated PAP2 superfamily phosphatase